MKKLFFLLLICIGVGSLFFYLKSEPTPSSDAKIQVNTPAVAARISPEPFIPTTLKIPTLKINAPIESVGLDQEKRMDVPKDDMNVGWYKYGPIPGEKGSAVLAGHFDTKTGGAAVFYKLSELQVNDAVIIIGKNGEERIFVVTDKKIFKDETFPIPLVFSQDDTEHLNLITCDGVFDKNEKDYTDRLVVFTKLKKS